MEAEKMVKNSLDLLYQQFIDFSSQSHYDRLLQALCSVLNNDMCCLSIHAVTLHPSLEQLACVAYSAVAKHLPSMLRQWHLGLDRQTSTLVNRCVHLEADRQREWGWFT